LINISTNTTLTRPAFSFGRAKAQVLSKVQGFSDLSLKARTMILDQLEFEEHKKGTELAVQNQIGADCMYFLIGGGRLNLFL